MDQTRSASGRHRTLSAGPERPAGPAGHPPAPRTGLDAVTDLLRRRVGASVPGSLWAALLDRGDVRLVVPLRERAPRRCDEDAEDRALLALLDAVGVPGVVLAVPRPGGRPLAEDGRLWRRARSGAVGLTVRLLGMVVVSGTQAVWVDEPSGAVSISDSV